MDKNYISKMLLLKILNFKFKCQQKKKGVGGYDEKPFLFLHAFYCGCREGIQRKYFIHFILGLKNKKIQNKLVTISKKFNHS